jgi:hypothetical protein
VLVVITFWPEFAPPWSGRPHVRLLSLSRLLPRQRPETIAHVPRGKTLPKEIAERIIDRTDGVPLFIEELIKTVAESGSVVDASDRFYGERTGSAAGNPDDCSGDPRSSKQTCAERGDASSIGRAGATEIAKTFGVAAGTILPLCGKRSTP